MTKMQRVGTCTVCGTGNLGIRVASSLRCVVAMCDECEAVWLDAELTNGPHSPPQPELPCPSDGSSLLDEPAHWANRDEAVAFGWGHAIIEESPAFG